VNIALVVKTLSHYHRARFENSHQKLKALDVSIYFIVLAESSSDYSWRSSEENEGSDVNLKILYKNTSLEEVSQVECSIKLVKVFRDLDARVVLFSNYSYFPFFASAIVNKLRRNCVNVIISDSTYFDRKRNFIFERLKKLVLAPYELGLCAGERSENYLMSLGLKKKNIFMPCDVVDNAAISEMIDNTDRTAKYYLCIARLIEEKNLFRLVDAYELLIQLLEGRDAKKLVICGDGPLHDELAAYISSKKLESKILLKGFVSQSEMYNQYYPEALCTVLPSVSETWGLVVNESFATGTPAIVSERAGCSPDLIIEDRTGYVVDPLSTKSISLALKRMDDKSKVELDLMRSECVTHISNWDLSHFSSAIADIKTHVLG